LPEAGQCGFQANLCTKRLLTVAGNVDKPVSTKTGKIPPHFVPRTTSPLSRAFSRPDAIENKRLYRVIHRNSPSIVNIVLYI
jgi:hypothetical protein